MKVRLGFAVAAQMEPDVLIIDEVLAVGDLGFVLKCFKTIDTILPKTAIIFVSHNMPMVSRICNKIILMDRGEAKFQGDVSKAIDLYYSRFASNDSNVVYSDNTFELLEIKIENASSVEGLQQIKWGNELRLQFVFLLKGSVESSLRIDVIIFDKEQRPVALLKDSKADYSNFISENKLVFNLLHKNLQLSKGIYSLNLSISDDKSPKYRVNTIFEFQVTHDQDIWQPFLLEGKAEKIS
jgi:lipopolysaccharide transport system ATP-binding protein